MMPKPLDQSRALRGQTPNLLTYPSVLREQTCTAQRLSIRRPRRLRMLQRMWLGGQMAQKVS